MTDLTPRTVSGFGWLPDRPNKQDFKLSAHLESLPHLPDVSQPLITVPHWNERVAVRDQGQLGSCTANSGDELMTYVRNVAPRSRLQIYYETRRLEGTVNEDSGAYNRDVMKVISTLGAGRESWWPYDDGPDKFKQDPIDKVDRDALKRKIFTYYRLDNAQAFGLCLAEGFPFLIGFTVFTRFMSPEVGRHGIASLPDLRTEREEGGHSITVWGRCLNFHDHPWAKWAMDNGLSSTLIPDQVYFCRNHWSGDWGLPKLPPQYGLTDSWGHKSNFVLPCSYLEDQDLADDPWTPRMAADQNFQGVAA